MGGKQPRSALSQTHGRPGDPAGYLKICILFSTEIFILVCNKGWTHLSIHSGELGFILLLLRCFSFVSMEIFASVHIKKNIYFRN